MAKVAKTNNVVSFEDMKDDFDALIDAFDAEQIEEGLDETCEIIGTDAATDEDMTQHERTYAERLTYRRRLSGMRREALVHTLDIAVDNRGNKIGIKPSVHNVSRVLNRDDRIAGAIGLNLMSGQVLMLKSVRFGIQDVPDIHVPAGGMDFNRSHEAAIAAFLGASEKLKGYGMSVKTEVLRQGVLNAAQMNAFDPLVQAIYDTQWDGVARLETSFVKWFNLDDNPYNRALSRFFLAFIERRFNPGAKFDHVPVLISRRQGTFKSTSVEVLSLGHYGEFRTPAEFSDPKKLIEATEGAALMEVPEMAALLSLHHNVVKSTISARKDRARGAYAISATTTMRSWLMLGTSNDGAFLRDPTGNRRFWPIYLNDKLEAPVNIELMRQEILQVYAEALVVYREMRKSQPHGDLPYHMTGEAAEMAQQLQARAAVETPEQAVAGWLQEWLAEPAVGKFCDVRIDGQSFRSRFCMKEAFNAYHRDAGQQAPDYDAKATKLMSAAIARLDFVTKGATARFPEHGSQQSYVVDQEWIEAQAAQNQQPAPEHANEPRRGSSIRDEWEFVEAAFSDAPAIEAVTSVPVTSKPAQPEAPNHGTAETAVSLDGLSVPVNVASGTASNVIYIAPRK
ncbi:VapE domain-containing protein [Paracoccus versutus]|uniref:VapE domain-containing protein n=1 Tax=Paracoccus versutus TaxID=34007 RepID=UPI000DF7524E|nr:VapE domain-containing protein [Paracoccus versutus]RDD72942.1 hypothetical protein DVR11_03170 [Paracoccus versutus]